jgi:two-component system cell cycle sensor histidine kinase/response regulator CckA
VTHLRTQRALLNLFEQTSRCTGEAFFRCLAKGLAELCQTKFGFVGVRASPDRIRMLALWDGESFGAPFDYELPGTPCQGVIDGETCQYLSGVQQRFPSDLMLVELGIEAYFGTAFGESASGARGLLVALHDAPCAEVPDFESTLSVLGMRAAAELARLESEAARRGADERYRTIVETCSEGVWMIDAEGRTTFVNAQMAAMLGYSPDEMLGRSLMDFMDDEGREQSRRNLERRREGVREGHEFPLLHRDGRRVHTWMNTSPVRDAAGAYVGALAMVTDMTEQRALEAKLRESERLESLGLLAGGIAHDFNNLLAAILGRAELARDRVDPTHPARPLVEGIRIAADRASHLTQQLLAYAGRAPIAAQPVDLHEVVRELASLCRGATGDGARIELSLGESPLIVRADPGGLTQVVLNLLTNGLQAVRARGTHVAVETRVERVAHGTLLGANGEPLPGGEYATLVVRDDGVGMDSATLARVFEPFFTSKSGGRGLGLAAVHGMVRGHGGAIDVSSAPGVGSAFVVRLPLASTEPAASARPAGAPASLARRGAGLVLVADDEALVREVVILALETEGYDVVSCADGEEALERFSSDPDAFVAVILDATMPRLGGFDAARSIRARRPRTPVLILSGYADGDIPLDLSQVTFVHKPFRIAALLDALARTIAR